MIQTVEEKLFDDIAEDQKRFFAIKLLEKDDKMEKADETFTGCIC